MISCTSCGDIPMRSFAKPLSGAAWPMTSPVKLPSIDRVSTPRGASAPRSLPVLAQAASRSTLAPVMALNTLFIPIFPLGHGVRSLPEIAESGISQVSSVVVMADVDGMPSACIPATEMEMCAMGLKRVRERRNDALAGEDWARVERLLADYYRGQSYAVEHCGTGGRAARFDGGVDLRLRRDGKTIL